MTTIKAWPPKRTTSAGYRLPLPMYNHERPSRPRSAYHDSCIPQRRQQQQHAPSQDAKTLNDGDHNKCDAVTNDKIWKQNVESESRCLKNWQENWGFLTEFDPKGRPKTPKELPGTLSRFSDGPVPNTNAGHYGGRLTTDAAEQMQTLEFRFYSGQRRRKMGSDLICY